MKTAPLPPNEAERLRLLQHLEILDTAPEAMFDDITRSVALICDAPIVLICLVDEYRQWFKSKVGLDADETARDIAFCAHAILEDEVLIIPDALKDERFIDNPLVSGEPKVRFYAGAPLKLTPTIRVGTLCVIDHKPRVLDRKQMALLELLSSHVMSLIRLRLHKIDASRDFSDLVMVKQKLQYQKDLFEAILDNEPESVIILARTGSVEQINHAGLNMLELGSVSEARCRKLGDFVLPEFRDNFAELERKVFQGEHAMAEYKIKGARGTERWMESHAAPLHNQQGEIANLIAVTRDITDLKHSQQELILAARVFGEAQEGIIITDADGTIVNVNPAFCAITGYRREEIVGQNPRILQSGKQSPDFYTELWQTVSATGHWKGEIWNRKKNGELYAELISINALRDEAGRAINYIALFLDITEVKRQRENQEQAAHYDAVTGLPKHAIFADRFQQALVSSKRDKTMLAVCHLDLDHFRQLNHTLGHEACDAILSSTARRIQANMRGRDTASSLGGDEFVLLIGDIREISDCEHALNRIHRAIAEPHHINGQHTTITASSGVALFPAHGADRPSLLRHAEQAMRQAKQDGRNRWLLFNDADKS